MKLTLFLLISIVLNLMLFMTQTGINYVSVEEGIENPNVYFQYNDSQIKDFNLDTTGGYQLDSDFEGALPGGSSSVAETSGNIFTDTFKAVRNWVLDATGLKYIIGALNALPNFIKLMGLPTEIAFALGYVWHLATVFALVFWIKGGGS